MLDAASLMLTMRDLVYPKLEPELEPLKVHLPSATFTYADARVVLSKARERQLKNEPTRIVTYQATRKAFAIWGDAAKKHGNPFSFGHDHILSEVYLRLSPGERAHWRPELTPVSGQIEFQKVPDAAIVDGTGEIVRFHEAVGGNFDFSFERRQTYQRHQQITMSPSDPNPDVQQDDNYATQRLKERWGQYFIGVKALRVRADGPISVACYGLLAAVLFHVFHQFWNGLDHVAFVGVIATTLARGFAQRRSDDARYGGMHSVLWGIAAIFVAGRMIAVYLNVYPSSVPNLGLAIINGLKSGTRLDDWMPFVGKAPLEWGLVLTLILSWRNKERQDTSSNPEPV